MHKNICIYASAPPRKKQYQARQTTKTSARTRLALPDQIPIFLTQSSGLQCIPYQFQR
jgi:hypothetical protein